MVKRGADRPSPGYHPVNRALAQPKGPQIGKLGELGRLDNIPRISSMGPMFLKVSKRGVFKGYSLVEQGRSHKILGNFARYTE